MRNTKLIEEMESQLPIPVYPAKDLASYLSQNGKDINPESFVISITLLRLKPDHPMFDKISAYQKQGIRSIFRSKGLKPRRR